MLGGQGAGIKLLSGILQEANKAKETTMWSSFPASVPIISQTETYSPTTPYLFIPSFGEMRKQTSVRAPRSPGQRGRTPKGNNSSPNNSPSKAIPPKSPTQKEPPPKNQQENQIPPEHPQGILMKEESGETWTLRCVCNLLSGDGLLVVCEKCGCWQHAICMGLNDHTVPEHYFCDICANKRIRCKCGHNLNFRSAIIKCTKCGYYVHKSCEGLGYGMMPKGDFVCHFCGKPEFHFDRPVLDGIDIDDSQTVTFSQPKIDDLPAEFLNGPFADFFKQDLLDTTVSARYFCEMLYDKFRSFFFLAHQKYNSNNSKKKRNKLVANFLRACIYMCRTFYNIDEEKCIEIFDSLINKDIYMNPTFKNEPDDPPFGLTETAYVNLPRLSAIVRFASPPRNVTLKETQHGDIICTADLVNDQFICLINDGLVGDIEEYNVESKVDKALYAIHDSRFVLDTTHAPNMFLHKLKRSIEGNCALKMFQVGDQTLCGLFATKAHLCSSPEDPPHVIKAGTPLCLGIDWIPAILDDVSKYLSWQFIEEYSESDSPVPSTPRSKNDRDSFSRTNSPATLSQSNSRDFIPGSPGVPSTPKSYGTPEKGKRKIKEEPKKKKRGRQRKNSASVTTEVTLFSIMMDDSPGDLLFSIVNEYQTIQSQSVDYLNQAFQLKTTKEQPKMPARSKTPSSSALAAPPPPIKTHKVKSPEHSDQESDDSATTADEAYEESHDAHSTHSTHETEVSTATSVDNLHSHSSEVEKTKEDKYHHHHEEEKKTHKEEKVKEDKKSKEAAKEKEEKVSSPKEDKNEYVEEKESEEEEQEEKLKEKEEKKGKPGRKSKARTKKQEKAKSKSKQKVEKDEKEEEAEEQEQAEEDNNENEEEANKDHKAESKETKKEKTEEIKPKKDLKPIFNDEAVSKLTRGLGRLKYKGLKVTDPSEQIKNILGI